MGLVTLWPVAASQGEQAPASSCPMVRVAATRTTSAGPRFSVLNRSSTRDDVDDHERNPGGGIPNRRSLMPGASDLKWVDQFPYYPAYRYHSYRSCCGAVASIFFTMILFLRVVSSISEFVDRPPIVTEAREQFPRDSTVHHQLPRIGVQFRQNGWKPFSDPRYLSIIFEQGVISMSGNVTYVDLGNKQCAFVDKDGRLIADGALCPLAEGASAGYLQGDFHDFTFAFVRARLARCDNGTDVEGKPLPGMCVMPEEIDRLVYEGVLYMFEQETDMRVDDSAPFLRIRQWRREFVTGVHISTDVFFTVRQVTQEAQYIFDAYMPGFQAGNSFTLLHATEVSDMHVDAWMRACVHPCCVDACMHACIHALLHLTEVGGRHPPRRSRRLTAPSHRPRSNSHSLPLPLSHARTRTCRTRTCMRHLLHPHLPHPHLPHGSDRATVSRASAGDVHRL